MVVPIYIGAVAQSSLAAILAYSSLAKIPTVGAFRDVLRRLGAGGLAGPLALAVIAGELLTAVMLLAVPTATWPRMLVVLFAFVFGAAGVRALLLREQVRCNCFGAGGRGAGLLGRRQLALLPAWLAVAGVAQVGAPRWDADRGIAGLTLLMLAFSGLRVPAAVRARRALKNDRAAFAESTGIGAVDPVRAKELTLG